MLLQFAIQRSNFIVANLAHKVPFLQRSTIPRSVSSSRSSYSKAGRCLHRMSSKTDSRSRIDKFSSLQTFQSYGNSLVNTLRNPSKISSAAPAASNVTPEAAINTVRNVNRAQLATAGVVFAEVLGFFTVGEMIGRMKIVGYRGEVHHEH